MKPTLASLAAYVAAVLGLTWPLAAHLTTHLPATRTTWMFDGLYGVWALAWETHALATAPWHLFDGNAFHPARHVLLYGPTALGALPWFAPVFLASGNPVLAMNVTFLAGIALSAWTVHLVVQRWTGSHLAGAVGAATWLATPYVLLSWLPTAPYYAVLPFVAPIVFLAATPLARRRDVALLAALVALQGLTDPAYLLPAILAALGVIALARVARRESRPAGLRLMAAVGLALVAILPVVGGYLAVRTGNPHLDAQTFWTVPAPETSLPLGLLKGSEATAVPFASLALIVAGWLASRGEPRRAWTHAALWAVVGVFVSLTPLVLVRHVEIPLPPQKLAEMLGVYRAIRAPARLAIAALFGLSLLAGLGFAACAARLRARGGVFGRSAPVVLAGLVLTAILGDAALAPAFLGRQRLPVPYPIAAPPAPPPRLTRIIAEHGGPLLELPLGPRGIGPVQHARAMYGSIFHWQSILNGYSSYWPAGFDARMALAARLPNPDAVAKLRRKTGLRLLLVHTAGLLAWRQTWLTLAGAGTTRPDLRLLAREGDDLLFVVGDE